MEAIKLRNKLVEQFNVIIKDDSKLMILDGVFDAMNSVNSASLVPEEYYKLIETRRSQRLAGETEGLEWDVVKKNLKKDNGF